MGQFADALRAPGLRAIAEIKRRSPSAGDLRPDADPARIAASYARAGAAAVSVLVDERFAGTWDDLRAARAASDVPLLAKGFFSTPDDLRTAKRGRRGRGAAAPARPGRRHDRRADGRGRPARARHARRGARRHGARARDRPRRPRAGRQRSRPLHVRDRPRRTARARRLDPSRPSRRCGVRNRCARTRGCGRARGRRRDPRRLGPDARARSCREARRARRASSRQGLRSHTRGRRRGGRRGRGGPPRLRARPGEPARRRTLCSPFRTTPSRSRSGSAPRARALRISTRCTRSSRARCAAATRRSTGTVRLWRRSSTCPGGRTTRRTGNAPRRRRAGSSSRAASARRTSPPRSRAVEPWAVDASSSLELSPGIKDHARVRAYVEAARG